MFYRGTHKLSGSGLGLYITKLNVEKLNGTIKFESSYGQGTKFVIKFPNSVYAKHANPLLNTALAFSVQVPGWCQLFESHPFSQY
jgi:hypothetical protein